MNGQEVEVNKDIAMRTIQPMSYSNALKLSPQDKINCVSMRNSPFLQTLWKLAEIIVVEARDEAMCVDPAHKEEQAARTTEAYVMNKLYWKLRIAVENGVSEHLSDLDAIASREALEDQAKIEEIILNQR